MGNAIQQGYGHLSIAEHLHPFGEVQIGGDDQRCFLVQLANQMKQQSASRFREWQVAEFIKDHGIDGLSA